MRMRWDLLYMPRLLLLVNANRDRVAQYAKVAQEVFRLAIALVNCGCLISPES